MMVKQRFWSNDGSGYFTNEADTRLPGMGGPAMAAVFGDVDNDSDIDLVIAFTFGGSRLYINDGSGVFSDDTDTRLPDLSGTFTDVALADIDRDGDPDLLVARRDTANLVLLNDSAGHFIDESAIRIPQDNEPTMAIVPVDVNGDNAPDLFIANDRGQDRLYLNNGLGLFSDETGARMPAAAFSTLDARVSDIDADGYPDLLLAAGNDGIQILINDTTGVFINETASFLPSQTGFTIQVRAGDLDYDGDLDLVAANSGQDTVFLYDEGLTTFVAAPAGFYPEDQDRSFGLSLFDADNDFDLDLAVAVPGSRNKFLVNTIDFPRIKASFSPEYVEAWDTIDFAMEAFDEDGISSTGLTIVEPDNNEIEVTVAGGTASFTPTKAGLHTAVFKAQDGGGTQGSWSSAL